MNTKIRDTRRLELENEITRVLYDAGELSLKDLADRVGRTKSPAFRRVISEMTSTGTLTYRWTTYKHTGKILVSLAGPTYDRLWNVMQGSSTWGEKGA